MVSVRVVPHASGCYGRERFVGPTPDDCGLSVQPRLASTGCVRIVVLSTSSRRHGLDDLERDPAIRSSLD
jgi:hypothetical protein